VSGILQSLDFNGTFVYQLIDFALLFIFLRIFVWPPLVKALQKRREGIANDIAAAETERKEAERLRQEREEALSAARAEAQAIVERAERTAADEARTLVAEARAQAERIKAEVTAETARVKEGALRALRDEVADLALLAAGRVLGHEVGGDEDRRLAQEFVAEVGRGNS
jgi:F-type H+-transporting ATPase subunit b